MSIFVLCPGNSISGGPELAHQFCHSINQHIGYSARICYIDVSMPVSFKSIMKQCGHDAYKEYRILNCSSLEEMDQSNNVVIIPEGLTLLRKWFQKAQIIIWWMSVDNYFQATNGIDLNELNTVNTHLVQSFYARKFCENKFPASTILDVSDYIHCDHGTFLFPAEYRQNIVLYNPKKGYDVLQKVKEQINFVKWLPLVGLSREEMIVLMQGAKIYIDFGNHPGKDRIPREAAVNGCCIITNKRGSAAYYEDVPIDDIYKFQDPVNEVKAITEIIKNICSDFSEHQNHFVEYRAWIHGEKERFDKEVSDFLEKMNEYGYKSICYDT